MKAIHPRAFASTNSGLDPFLYADVGTEVNGSNLTIVSMLARLDQDPWKRAADWAALPTAAVIDDLSKSIAQMPLTPAVLAGSRDIATRLVKLLPSRPQHGEPVQSGGATPSATSPNWFAWCCVAAWMLLNVMLTHKVATDGAAPVEQPISSGSISQSTAPPPSVAAASAARVPVVPMGQERTPRQ